MISGLKLEGDLSAGCRCEKLREVDFFKHAHKIQIKNLTINTIGALLASLTQSLFCAEVLFFSFAPKNV